MTFLSPSELLRAIPTAEPKMVQLWNRSPRRFLWLGDVDLTNSVEHLVAAHGDKPSTVEVLTSFFDRCDLFEFDLVSNVLPMISSCLKALVANLSLYPEVWSRLPPDRRLMVQNVVAPLIRENELKDERNAAAVLALVENLDRQSEEKDPSTTGSGDQATERPDH